MDFLLAQDWSLPLCNFLNLNHSFLYHQKKWKCYNLLEFGLTHFPCPRKNTFCKVALTADLNNTMMDSDKENDNKS